MAIDAVFEHEDGYKFNEIFSTARSFLRALRKRKTVFIHAVDYDNSYIIYPSNLPDYRRVIS
jgi:hypothetical protein